MLYAVYPADLEKAWPDLAPLVADACRTSSGRFLPVDVLEYLHKREWQLWVVRPPEGLQAIIVTQIVEYPRAKALRLRIVTGKGRLTWQAMAIEQLERWARELGCNLIEGEARPGWARVAERFGYTHTHSLLEKVL